MGLFDMVMIKDNHISTAGGVTNALKAVDLYLEKNSLQLEVEVVLSFILSRILSKALILNEQFSQSLSILQPFLFYFFHFL